MKDELAALKGAAAKGSYALLDHIYQNHPPKDPSAKLEPPTPANIKKVLLKAVVHYHPDKQNQYERKWQVLCEEITKCLNASYEIFK